jgi:hypothetical protein
MKKSKKRMKRRQNGDNGRLSMASERSATNVGNSGTMPGNAQTRARARARARVEEKEKGNSGREVSEGTEVKGREAKGRGRSGQGDMEIVRGKAKEKAAGRRTAALLVAETTMRRTAREQRKGA